uniref:Uncharacterized protein n=1 Tax=Rhodnius prolixus TaxID=13249 RepID=T1I0T9_RHOPR
MGLVMLSVSLQFPNVSAWVSSSVIRYRGYYKGPKKDPFQRFLDISLKKTDYTLIFIL